MEIASNEGNSEQKGDFIGFQGGETGNERVNKSISAIEGALGTVDRSKLDPYGETLLQRIYRELEIEKSSVQNHN